MEQPARIEFKAIVTSAGSTEMNKSNGGKYILQNCKIVGGPLNGQIVSGTRTILNKDGVAKEPIPVGTEVRLYLTRVPSATQAGGFMNFFDISTGAGASQADINALLGATLGATTEQVLAEQETI